MSTFLNPLWLKDYYQKWTDDDLHDRYREISTFGGAETEMYMIEVESKRRSEEYAASSQLLGTCEGSTIAG